MQDMNMLLCRAEKPHRCSNVDARIDEENMVQSTLRRTWILSYQGIRIAMLRKLHLNNAGFGYYMGLLKQRLLWTVLVGHSSAQ